MLLFSILLQQFMRQHGDHITEWSPFAMNTTKARLLIVDDEKDLRTLLSDVLLTQGYEISSAEDGEEAIAMLQRDKYDLTLLDLQMPNVDGIQVLKFIKEHSPKTRAIVLTGYADLKHAMEAKEFGASDFIGKPYKLHDVLSTIERVLIE
jgi:DNA-binding NtrC family response regulator